MVILGLDLATHKSGYGLIDSKGALIKYGLIQADKKEKDFRKRIVQIGEQVENIIRENNPDIICIEEVPIYNEAGSYLLVMQGYVVYIAHKHGKKLYFYRPSEWRKKHDIIGKNGKEALKKSEVKKRTVTWANDKFGLSLVFFERDTKDKISEDDVADAIGVGYAYYVDSCSK